LIQVKPHIARPENNRVIIRAAHSAPMRGRAIDMNDPVTMWHREHVRFTWLLDFLEQQIASFHAGEHPDYELMRDAVHYLQHYANRFHHPRADVAFAKIAERDPSARLTINRLLQEHRVIDVAGAALLKHLEDILEDTVVERSSVEAAAATYFVYYRHHLATEEAAVLPRAAKLLTPDDWAEVAASIPDGPDPLFGDDINARYRDLHMQIARAM
jgi:hemerythrin-like domain-containing protein